MEDKKLYILAGYDDATEAALSGIQNKLYEQGFVGTHTKNLPAHITLDSFPTEKEEIVKALLQSVAANVSAFDISFSHVGVFSGGYVLFIAPDVNRKLLNLKECFGDSFDWAAHTTMLIDEPDVIARAMPEVIKEFKPFVGKVTKLHLYEFFPTRYITTVNLREEEAAPGDIRAMAAGDIPECVTVIRKAFKTVADEFGFTEENAPRFTAFATDEGRLTYHLLVEKRPMYVFSQQGRILGYYSLALSEDGSAELNNLAVLPEFRHNGIGAKLLEDCFTKARMLGKSRLKIGIVEENKVLRSWYEKHGFVHTGTQKFDFFPFTCGYMEKRLENVIE